MTPLNTLPQTKQTTTKAKKKLPRMFDFGTEALETMTEPVRGFAGDVAKSMQEDLIGGGKDDLLKQLLGKYEQAEKKVQRLAGDLEYGQEVDLAALHSEKPKRRDIQPGLDIDNYHRDIIRSSERSERQREYQMDRQVEEIQLEIKHLIATTKGLEAQFTYAALEQKPVEVGKYHTAFFEWFLAVIRGARMKIEDSGAWLATMAGKKNKRDYWAMFKKHGTSFGMSNERSVATQTG